MNWKKYLLFAMAVVTGVGLGFFLESVVFAGGGEPGSVSDPLVARSYVDEQVQNYIEELEEEITALNTRASKLEKELADLQTSSGITPVEQGGTEPGSEGGQQVVFIKEDNSYVNLRTGPGTNHEITGRALPGEPLVVLGQDGDWYQVRLTGGNTAWIAVWLVTAPS